MKQKYFLYMSLFALILGSCQKDNENNVNNNEPVVKDPVAIQLSALTIKETSTESLEVSRVANGKWENADMIGVFMLHDGTYNIAGENANKAYITETGDGLFTPVKAEGLDNTIYLPADGSYMDIIAYYPYMELDEGSNCVINLVDQSVQNKLDIMRGTPAELAYNNSSPKVDLTFRHRMSRINITLVAGEGVMAEELKNTRVELDGFHNSCLYNPIKDLFSTDAPKEKFKIFTSEDGKYAQGIVMPEKFSSEHKIYVTPGYYLEGESAIFNISEKQGFISGKSYNYTITFNRDGITIEKSNIEDWVEAEGESGTIIDDTDK